MKSAIALILLIVGFAMMLGGFVWAVWAFAQMYGSTLNDPMSSSVDGKLTSSSMLTAATIGGVGFIPATIGSFMLDRGIIARIFKKRRG